MPRNPTACSAQIDVEEGVSKAPFIKENSCEEEGRATRTPGKLGARARTRAGQAARHVSSTRPPRRPSPAAGAWCIKSRSRRDQPTLTEAAAEAEPRIPYLAAIFALGFLCPLLWFYGWARHSLVKPERWVGAWAGGRGGWPPA